MAHHCPEIEPATGAIAPLDESLQGRMGAAMSGGGSAAAATVGELSLNAM